MSLDQPSAFASRFNRRDLLRTGLATGLATVLPTALTGTANASPTPEPIPAPAPSPIPSPAPQYTQANWNMALGRPVEADRRFVSPVVDAVIERVQKQIANPVVAKMFAQCFPNTLDTTVFPRTEGGKPDTFVITGDIDAMWLRDSSAQVHPYLRYARQDARLGQLLQGVIRRQTRCILIDPYANSFNRTTSQPPLSWAVHDRTTMKPGVAERKWEIDSLCYTVRLAYGYWQATQDKSPFDAEWREAAQAIVNTFSTQQRLNGQGPYSFGRLTFDPYDTVALDGYGNMAKPNGMIFSMFRPSDDACTYPLFVPANLFAVQALKMLAELAQKAAGDAALANQCDQLGKQVLAATEQYGKANHGDYGQIWAYEVDGYGNANLMDDANVPSLLGMPYLGCCATSDALYQRTRRFVLSESNPYFFIGSAAEGVGSPHTGRNAVWPMGILIRALTSTQDDEILSCLRMLRDTTAGTDFMHESFNDENPANFTRPWFAWANTLFGELIVTLAEQRPQLLQQI